MKEGYEIEKMGKETGRVVSVGFRILDSVTLLLEGILYHFL